LSSVCNGKFISLQSFKKDNFKSSLKIRIKIKKNNKIIGYLVPIGSWILEKRNIYKKIFMWRKKNINFFFDKNKITLNSTLSYLANCSINDSSRILFLIYTNKNNVIGNVGISNYKNGRCELDNLARGVPGGDKELIFNSEKTILRWSFNFLRCKSIMGQVRSDNYIMLNMHKKIGFKIIKTNFLKFFKINKNRFIYKFVSKNKSNVSYQHLTIKLNKKNFI